MNRVLPPSLHIGMYYIAGLFQQSFFSFLKFLRIEIFAELLLHENISLLMLCCLPFTAYIFRMKNYERYGRL